MNNTPGMKICVICGDEKALDEFHRHSKAKDGRNSYCKECKREHSKKWRTENSGQNRKRQKQWRENNPHYSRDYYRMRIKENPDYQKEQTLKRYNMTLEDKKKMAEEQDYKCLICNITFELHKLEVDHDHETGEVRGLLCQQHNKMLGFADDNIEYLENGISYIKKYK